MTPDTPGSVALRKPPHSDVSCIPSNVTPARARTMKPASDQAAPRTSVRPVNQGRSSGWRSVGSAAAAHSGQSTQRDGSQRSSQPAQAEATTTRRPTGPMRPNQPSRTSNTSALRSHGDAAEDHHAHQRDDGVADHERTYPVRRGRRREHELRPDAGREQEHRRPACRRGGVGKSKSSRSTPRRWAIHSATAYTVRNGLKRRPRVADAGAR